MGFETFVIDFLDHLKYDKGFLISEETASFILSAISQTSTSVASEEDIMNIFRFTVCKTEQEYNAFPNIFKEYYREKIVFLSELSKQKEKREKERTSAENKIKSLKKQLLLAEEKEKTRKLEEQNRKKEECSFFNEMKGREAFLKKAGKNKEFIKKLIKDAGMSREVNALAERLFFNTLCEKHSPTAASFLLTTLQGYVKKIAFKAAMAGDTAVIDLLKKAKDAIAEEIERAEKEKKGKKDDANEVEALQKKLTKAIEDANKLKEEQQKELPIQKEASRSHRPEFIGGYRSVFSNYKGDISLEKNIKQINQEDMEKLHYFIRKNAKRFKTKISKNIGTANRERYDIKTIVKKACATDGVPVRLAFKKPIPNKPKLVLILDVSGSCKSASRLMLLFMYYLKQAFSGGCEVYAFTNVLYDISSLMSSPSPTEAIDSVLASIPRSGAYSDYNKPFTYFHEHNMNKVNKDTIVVIIGDARNNRNPTGEEHIREISRKARACFWLNTEAVSRWDTGDSVMMHYAPYMQDVLPILTVGELVTFITNFKIRKGKFCDYKKICNNV